MEVKSLPKGGLLYILRKGGKDEKDRNFSAESVPNHLKSDLVCDIAAILLQQENYHLHHVYPGTWDVDVTVRPT